MPANDTDREDIPVAQETDADLGDAQQEVLALARHVATQFAVEDRRVFVQTLFQTLLQRAAPHDLTCNGCNVPPSESNRRRRR